MSRRCLLERSRRGIFSDMSRKPSKRAQPLDVNQLASSIVEQVTDEAKAHPEKNPAAVALGRLGGLKGGRARAARLSPSRRKAIAKKAAKARWSKRD